MPEEEDKSSVVEDQSKSSVDSSSFIETAIKSEDKKATIYHRYYHVFKEGELEELITLNFSGKFEIRISYRSCQLGRQLREDR